MAEALQSKTQGKKELVERNSVDDLALRVRGRTKGVQRLIENDCNALISLSLSLFSFPAILFLN